MNLRINGNSEYTKPRHFRVGQLYVLTDDAKERNTTGNWCKGTIVVGIGNQDVAMVCIGDEDTGLTLSRNSSSLPSLREVTAKDINNLHTGS